MRWFVNSLLLLYLLAASAADIKRKTISAKMAGISGTAAIVCHFLWPQEQTILWLAGMIPGIILLVTAWLTRQAVGFGDGCVLTVIGMYIGFAGSMGSLLTGLLLSCPVSLFLLACRKVSRKQTIPFVPFLTAGCLIWMIIQKNGG